MHRVFAQDLHSLIGDWDYDPDRVSVRRILGIDGRLKLQMRVDLGVMQVEYRGRPDGRRVEGFATCLDYQSNRLSCYIKRCGTSLGFAISNAQCGCLRSELMQYYQRVVCLFILDAFDEAVADLDHCHRIIELCTRYGRDTVAIDAMLAIVPHLVVMNTKAVTSKLLGTGQIKAAFDRTLDGVCELLNHYCTHGTLDDYRASPQVDVLERIRLQLGTRLDADDRTRLRRALRLAVREERFEEAARLRNALQELGAWTGPPA